MKKVGASLGWHLKSSKSLAKSPWNEIISDEIDYQGKRQLTYTYVRSPGAVFVIPVTQDGRFVLIRNYRWTIDQVCWEVPAGLRNHPQAKTLEELARAEMKEEAGCVGGELTFLGEFFSANGVCDLKLALFLATNVQIEQSEPEDTETILEVKAFSRQELEAMLDRQEILDGDSVFALLLACRHLDRSVLKGF